MSIESPETKNQSVRDRLALERTLLANERTLLAYIRTAIMLAVTGASVLKFYSNGLLSVASGWALIFLGVGVSVMAVLRFQKLAHSLSESRSND